MLLLLLLHRDLLERRERPDLLELPDSRYILRVKQWVWFI